jgi:glycosyltransferase involved in cell wall biosynthesis
VDKRLPIQRKLAVRILIVNYEFPPIGAGAGKASYSIAKELAAEGHRVRVLTSQPVELYSLFGTVLIMLGSAIGMWLAYREITVNIDIGSEGWTIIAVLFVLSGLILRAMGLMWALLIPFKGLPKRELVDGIEIYRVPALRQRRESSSIIEMLSFLVAGLSYAPRHVRAFEPDIVHVFFGIPCGPIGWFIKRIHKTPYIISLRGADVPSSEVERFSHLYPLLKPILRHLWRDADALVAVSNGLRKIALNTSNLAITVIPNAIDLTMFTPKVVWNERECPDSDKSVRLLYVGRLIKFKNVSTLLNAIMLAKQRTNVPIKLSIVGEGVERQALERQAADLGLAASVQFRGWIERDEIASVYRQADVFVTASYWEGMPNTLLEAMACALPIVAADVQGSDELVKSGINGYLVPVNDAEALAQAILLLVEDRNERQRMGREGRKIAGETFTWQTIARAYQQVYESVIASASKANTTDLR